MKHSFNKHLYSLVTLFTICFLFWRCIPEELELPTRLKSVTTNKATNVAVREATLRGKVTLTDSDTITCGVIYGDSASLSSTNDVVVSTMANGEYSISLSTLKADATYYFRAYAVEDGRYKYGQVLSFKTRPDVSVATGETTNVKTRSATLTGTISDVDEGVPCGFIYGTTSELTSATGTKVSTTAKDKYSVSVKDLAPKTTYYYRAYAITYDEYKYGEVRSFTTSAYSAEAVDLGLTVKWASCNVGADVPEEFGGLYAWGETEEKDYYYWDSYKWGFSYNYMEKYFVGKHPDGRPVEPDNKTVLEPEDDVAHVVWGAHWYMPTLDEVNELLGACTAEWTIVNGVSGQKLTGPNGNSIFFPAAGLRDDFYDTSNILECRYWSSSLRVGGFCNVAHSFLFNDTISYETYEARYAGLSVRPVWRDRKDNIAVIPGDVTNISTSGATLSSVVCNTNRELTCGFIYGITSELSAASGTKISTTSKGEYALEVTKLNENTTYYYRAYVIVGDEYRLGEIRSFMTKSEASATTGEATNVTHSSVTLGGTVNNSQEKLTCGIIYSTSSKLSATSGTKVSTTSNGAFTINISSLHDNTTYYYCAYVIVGGQYKLGGTRSFKTNQGPYATTGSAQNVTYSSATLGGTVNNSQKKLTCGIIYSTSSTLSATSGTKVSTTSNGAYTINISSLQANTTYYYCAYVVVDGEYKLGTTRSFTTKDEVSVTTGEATNITSSSACLNGTINKADEPVYSGFCYGTSSSILSDTIFAGKSDGIFSATINDLQPSTTYYYHALAHVDGGYKSGEVRSFTTEKKEGTIGEVVDLGLSVKWASWNVGASSPEEYGDYFAWGETTTKSDYNSSTSVTYNLSISELESRGIIGTDGNLTPEYDAAMVNWSGTWRMPTLDEIDELVDNCTWEWTTMNGVTGHRVTGPNDNSIFLPAAGYRTGTSLRDASSYGYYWSVTPAGSNSLNAYSLSFRSGSSSSSNPRFFGHTVRPVYGKPIQVYTGEATNLTASSVTLSGTVNNTEESVTCGIIYGTTSTLSSTSGTMVSTSSSGEFSVDISSLSASTTYYYCAYVVVNGKYKYGEVRSFTTESLPGISTYSMNSTNGWTLSGVNDADTKNRAFESYAGWEYMEIKSGKISRSVTLTAGTYKLTGRAFYRYGEFNDENPTVSLGCMFAGNTEVVVPTLASESITTIAGASDAFYNQGLYENELKFTLSTSQTIQIGYHWIHEVMRSWFIAGDMILEKLSDTETIPTVTTGEATNITSSSVILEGTVGNSNTNVICGIIYGKTSSPSSISGSKTSTTSNGTYSVNLANLNANFTYNYRAYAVVDGVYKLGEVRSFTTVSEPGGTSKTYTVNGVSFTMIGVEGGTFTMGFPDSEKEASIAEKPAHQVTLSSYYIGETEVTQALWQAVMGSNPSVITGDLQRPVEHVSWDDCQTFISKLNELTGENFRLPTEAEWEYAARGGSASKGYKYSGSNNISDVAWYSENSSSTHVVKTKQPNELGIYDMSGNVDEWCSDWYGDYSSSAQTNPTGPSSGSDRVLRGGSWGRSAVFCRVADRIHYSPDFRKNWFGLRLVR